jgi:DNA polymerase III alpha subunit (gram-positive type)
MTDLIFLDTETTGLDPELHEVWEIAYAINDGFVETTKIPHSLATADPKALELNGYFSRGGDLSNMAPAVELRMKQLFAGNTLVCANPTFDRMFLRKRWGYEPWHYRSIDVESMAFAIFEYDQPQGLAVIRNDLILLGYDNIPEPNHSAGGDVNTLRECYKALREMQQAYRNAYFDREAHVNINPYIIKKEKGEE